VSEVSADRLDLGGQNDLVFVGDRLRVIALQKPAQALDDARVRVGDIDAPFRDGGRSVGSGGRPKRRPSFIRPRAR
jgi:hypothetical protein